MTNADRPGAGQTALTKILATVGPACAPPEMADRLLDAGMRLARINFGHGTSREHEALVATFRRLARARDIDLAFLGDLQGPKIRVQGVPAEGIELEKGQRVRLVRSADGRTGTDDVVTLQCTYDRLIDDIAEGNRLLINDGAVRALVVEKQRDAITMIVTHGGLVKLGKGINLPDTDVTAEALTERDWEHVRWAIVNDLDLVALSFTRSAAHVSELREGIARIASELGHASFHMPIVAKIESPQGVDEIASILSEADAIMVARGDLGVEMDNAQVPVIQKALIRAAQSVGKPCIVATQMLESMIENATPTRAEASDVAGAIYAHVDCVMLSGETAIGRYPDIAVEQMRRIARFTEADVAAIHEREPVVHAALAGASHTAALAHGVWTIAGDIHPRCVGVWSESGETARHLSQHNIAVPIIAFTSDPRAARQMQLLRGVTPIRVDAASTLGEFTSLADRELIRGGWVAPDAPYLLVAGVRLGTPGATNSVAIRIAGHLEDVE